MVADQIILNKFK